MNASASQTLLLKEISLTGYKSIRELKDFRLGSGLNALIGANGSGKTNFIRFFELLAHMMDPNKGLQNYVSERGRADAFLFRGMSVTSELRAHLKIGHATYAFSLKAAHDRSLYFSEEFAEIGKPSPNNPLKPVERSGHLESVLGRHQENPVGPFVAKVLRNWRIYHFHDTSPSAVVMGLCNIVDDEVLHSNAGNLAAFLMGLSRKHTSHFAQIEETVRQVAPFFGAFALKEVSPGQTQLLWKDRYSDLIYYPHQLSDGTLRYICLATLLLQPTPASTIIIDEPELGLHPYAIKLLASLLHEASQRAQLIVSTQSSLLVDEFRPEQIIVANHRGGETILERPNPEELSEWLKEYTLGQLWEKNALGGLP